jgi:hypothetical protein
MDFISVSIHCQSQSVYKDERDSLARIKPLIPLYVTKILIAIPYGITITIPTIEMYKIMHNIQPQTLSQKVLMIILK